MSESALDFAERLHEMLIEGNPLSRILQHDKEGRHSVIMSAERKGLSKEENASRMSKLKDHWRKLGHGFRDTEGKWDEGGGVGKENSIHVLARGPGARAGAELRHHARKLSKAFQQDAFIHRKPNGTGTAIDTRAEKAGERTDYGDSKYNKDNPYGETQYKKRKPEGKRPKLTFIPKD